ncbi:MAG: extracellular solute-binding protein [Candidatus Promineifilaceae bacterium]
MFKKGYLLFVICLWILFGCQSADSPTATSEPGEEVGPTEVPATDTLEPEPTKTSVPPTATPAPTETPALTGVLKYSAYVGGNPDLNWTQQNAEAYAAERGDLELIFNSGNYYNGPVNRSIHREITGDEPPDVMSGLIVGVLREYVEQGLIADISDLWAEQGWDEVFPASLKEMVTIDGKQYFVPQAIQWNGIYYRKDVFESVGLTPPETWEALLAACDTLNAAEIAPFTIVGGQWPPPMGFWFTAIDLRLNGPEFHERLMRGQERYDSPEVRAVFEHISEMFAHECFAPSTTSYTYSRAITQFESGDTAMYNHGEWLYEFIDEETKAQTGFFPYPIINPDVSNGELVPMFGAFIHANAENTAEARAFLIYLASQASQQSNAETLNRVVSNLLVDPSRYDEVHAQGLALVEGAGYITQLYGANTNPDVAARGYQLIAQFWQNKNNPDIIDQILVEWEAARQEAYGEIE